MRPAGFGRREELFVGVDVWYTASLAVGEQVLQIVCTLLRLGVCLHLLLPMLKLPLERSFKPLLLWTAKFGNQPFSRRMVLRHGGR